MLYLQKSIVLYPDIKARLIQRVWLVGLVVALIMLPAAPHLVLPFIGGVALAYGYLFSVFLFVEVPQHRLAMGLSFIRMACVSFLIAWMGQFKLLETCVVFCGFLSYKLILVLEFVRYSVGIKLNSGK